MKRIEFICCSIIAAVALASCSGFTSGSPSVKEPTTDQMKEMERQWGLKPRETTQRFETPATPGGATYGNPGGSGVPTQQQIDSLPIIPASQQPVPLPPSAPVPAPLR